MAVAGGLAGGMLLDELLHRRDEGGSSHGSGPFGSSNAGPFPSNDAATELETRQVDFGSGNDWDSGGGLGDTGGGSDGGGGWD